MSEAPTTPKVPDDLPLLQGDGTAPATLAPLALGAVLADMSLYPITSYYGLSDLGRFEGAGVARSVASMAFAAVVPLVLTHRAVTAKTRRDAALRLALAGVGYGFVSAFVALLQLGGRVRLGDGVGDTLGWLALMSMGAQAVFLPIALAGLVLAMGRPDATRDRHHRAALAAGGWLLWLGGPVRWSSFAASTRVEFVADPRTWSIPLFALGAALLWRGLTADRRLARRLAAARAGEAGGWRVGPVDATSAELPALYDAPPAEPDGVLLDPAGAAVARLHQEGVDDAKRLQRRAIGVAMAASLSVAALFATTFAWIFFMLPGRR